MAINPRTPGVYVEEISKFPPSVAEVETAIPAFIGYTEKAVKNGQPLDMKPTKIKSMLEFEKYFGKGSDITISGVTANSVSNGASDVTITPAYYLYDSLQIYYANGGGDCYIVSVGSYTDPFDDTHFTDGLKELNKYDEPTIILFPDAVKLIDPADHYSKLKNVQQAALKQCGALMDRVAILDVLKEDVDGNEFRNSIGMTDLDYGAAYFPWLKASLTKKITLNQITGFNLKDYTNTGNIGNMTINDYIDKYKQLLTDIDRIKSDSTNGTTAYLLKESFATKFLDLLNASSATGPNDSIAKIYDIVNLLDKYVKDDSVIVDNDFQIFISNSVIPIIDNNVATIIKSRLATPGTPTTTAGASWGNTALINKFIKIISGRSSSDERRIISHTPTTVTVDSDWTLIPDNSSKFEIYDSNENGGSIESVSPTSVLMHGTVTSAPLTPFTTIKTSVSMVASELTGKWMEINGIKRKIDSVSTPTEIVVASAFPTVPTSGISYKIVDPVFTIGGRNTTVSTSSGNATSGTLNTLTVAERWPAIRLASPPATAAATVIPDSSYCNSLAINGTIDAIAGALNLLQSGMNSSIDSYESTLIENIPFYANLLKAINAKATEIPPSGAIAGIYCTTDNERGVWKAPANVSLSYVDGVTEQFTASELDAFNIDVNAGKSINIIRSVTGRGTAMVMGARTLAGNDNEWRYIPVRRLFNMVEESCKKSTEWAVFEPNDANLWQKVKGMIENFLYNMWRRGALAGAKPEHAYYVKCGINVTMTAQDILEGKLNVEIGMAAVRPAEFIVLKFSHKLQES